MICFKDKTFCGSPDCTGKCGRKMTPEEEAECENQTLPVMYAPFCGDNN